MTYAIIGTSIGLLCGSVIRVIKRWRARPTPAPMFDLQPLTLSQDQIDDEWLLSMFDCKTARVPLPIGQRLQARGWVAIDLSAPGIILTNMGLNRIGYLTATYKVRPTKVMLT